MATKTTIKPSRVLTALQSLNLNLRYNECANRIEVGSQPMHEGIEAKIRIDMRERGYRNMSILTDCIIHQAYQNRYHPVRSYLTQAALQFDGQSHIARLASYVRDTDGVFSVWLRKWLIGAVAKVVKAEQNPILVLDGAQGIGKSELVRWLCPLPDYHIEAAILPDDKDTYLRIASKWIWEVAELGATVRRADREALKHIITLRHITVRPPYAKHDIEMPAMASFIGTVNDEAGLLNDPTGSRRFLVCHVESIDWKGYTGNVDISQVWAEAYAAYLRGESWLLSDVEMLAQRAINARYEIDDSIEGLLKRYLTVDKSHDDWWIPTDEILEILYGSGGITIQNSHGLGACARRLGLKRVKRNNRKGQKVWGFTGVAL